MTSWMHKPPRVSVRGGDPNCVHHFMFGRPEYMRGTKFMRERGECKKCGAIQEFLRPLYADWRGEDVVSISDIPLVKKVKLDDEPEE